MLVTVGNFHPCLIFENKVGNIILEYRSLIEVNFNTVSKYYARVESTKSDIHRIFMHVRINYNS